MGSPKQIIVIDQRCANIYLQLLPNLPPRLWLKSSTTPRLPVARGVSTFKLKHSLVLHLTDLPVVAQRHMAPAPTAPHVGNATQLAPAAPIQTVTFNPPTALTTAPVTPDMDQISVTTTQGLSSESASPQEGQYRQFMPAYVGPSYPSSTGNFVDASMSHTQRMPAHATTKGYGGSVSDGSMLTHPTTNGYDDLGSGGFMPAPRVHHGSNGLPIHFSDYLAAQFAYANGGFGQARSPYGYNDAGVYSSRNAQRARPGPALDPNLIDPALDRITKQFSSSV